MEVEKWRQVTGGNAPSPRLGGGLLMRCQRREGPGQGGLQGRRGPDHAAGGERWWGPSWLEESGGLEK